MARTKVSTGEQITVACKLPQGLHILLEDPRFELKLHGSNSPYAIGGHGMTRGVNAAAWARVETVYKGAKWLTSQAVFAMNDEQSASDKAVDQQKNRIGFEQIDPRDPNNGLRAGAIIQNEGEGDSGPRG